MDKHPHFLTHLLNELLRRGSPDEAVDVDVDKGSHEELAVKAVHDAAVTRNDVAKVLAMSKMTFSIAFTLFLC